MEQKPEKYLEKQYSHVQKFDKQKMDEQQIRNVKDQRLGDQICINRNPHNGQTTRITIKMVVKKPRYIYIAGDETSK